MPLLGAEIKHFMQNVGEIYLFHLKTLTGRKPEPPSASILCLYQARYWLIITKMGPRRGAAPFSVLSHFTQIPAVCHHSAFSPRRLHFSPPCYHFNVVTSSAVIFFCAPCHRARELTWNQMLASQLSHRGKKKNEVAEAYFFRRGASRRPNEPWPRPLTHSATYARQRPHDPRRLSSCSATLPSPLLL